MILIKEEINGTKILIGLSYLVIKKKILIFTSESIDKSITEPEDLYDENDLNTINKKWKIVNKDKDKKVFSKEDKKDISQKIFYSKHKKQIIE